MCISRPPSALILEGVLHNHKVRLDIACSDLWACEQDSERGTFSA